MKASAVYKEIMREYDSDRLAADKLQKIRRDEVYFSIPRVKEIDVELMSLGIKISRQILSSDKQTSEELIRQLQTENERLLKEKYELMSCHSFDENYLTDVHKCGECKDTGYIDTQRCKCLSQKLINKYYELSNIGGAMREENFDTFDLNYYSDEKDPSAGVSPRANMKKVYINCLSFVNEFDDKFDNLLLYGKTALGKTFLCNCIAKELLDKGKTVVYATSSQLFKLVEDLRFNRTEEDEPDDYSDMVLGSDLLIIDDLGTEFVTSVTVTELFNIINTRYLRKKSTVISTNLTPPGLEGIYSDRITSRILGNYRLLKLIGDDIRLKKRYGL